MAGAKRRPPQDKALPRGRLTRPDDTTNSEAKNRPRTDKIRLCSDEYSEVVLNVSRHMGPACAFDPLLAAITMRAWRFVSTVVG